MLPKINKFDMAGTMKAIKEYLRSHHGNVRAPIAYITRKTITVQNYGDYLMYVTPDDKMIDKMLNLPPKKPNSLWSKRVYGRVSDRQQKFLQHPGSDLQRH